MNILMNCMFIIIGFMMMIPDAYYLWQDIKPEENWWRKLRQVKWRRFFISLASLFLSWKMFTISLYVGLGRGTSYAIIGVTITLVMWFFQRFESPRRFFKDKPWKEWSAT